MSSRDARPLLVLGFCCATAGVLLGLAVAPDYPLAAPWVVAIVAFYVAGAWALRRRPDLPAARRLLLTGVVATAWFALGMAELLWYDAPGPGGSLWLLNAFVLGLDIALPVSRHGAAGDVPERRGHVFGAAADASGPAGRWSSSSRWPAC